MTQAKSTRPEYTEALALVDAIRLGNPRESQLAIQLFKEKLQTS